MQRLYVDRRKNKLVDNALKACAPRFKGLQATVVYNIARVDMRSAWDGDGNRTYYSMVRLADLKHLTAPESHPIYSNKPEWADVEIPAGFVVVAHKMSGSHDYVFIYVPGPPELLGSGEVVELTDDEVRVLAAGTYKASYRRELLWQRHRMRWEKAQGIQASLAERKLLRAGGSITIEGRNALEQSERRRTIGD